MIHEVTVVVNEGKTVHETIQTCLKKVCECAGWQVGHAYRALTLAGGNIKLASTDLWYCNEAGDFGTLRKITSQMIFVTGEGLPGRVFETRKPVWIPDVTEDENFPRQRLAKAQGVNLGVRGAFAFPILEGNKATYVLEFLRTP